MIFKKPKNILEGHRKLASAVSKSIGEDLAVTCPRCKKPLDTGELIKFLNICPYCRHHFRLNVRQRLNIICDKESFVELDSDLRPSNYYRLF